ncbi:MAG: hypothetical protein HFJ43_04075 [Clostridia bacterium]|nr:hypothetical protein [Clostridia bacterium]
MIAIEQARIFLIFIIIGILISFIFDIFRILRKVYKFTNLMIYIQDIVFWIIAGVITLFSIFKFNSGNIRLYLFFSMFIGVILYTCSLSNNIRAIGTIIMKLLNTIISKIIKLLYKPIGVIYKIICKLKNKLLVINKDKIKFNFKSKKSIKNNIML